MRLFAFTHHDTVLIKGPLIYFEAYQNIDPIKRMQHHLQLPKVPTVPTWQVLPSNASVMALVA